MAKVHADTKIFWIIIPDVIQMFVNNTKVFLICNGFEDIDIIFALIK